MSTSAPQPVAIAHAPNGRAKVARTITRAGGQKEDTSNHVDDECAKEDDPELVEAGDESSRALWDFVLDRVEDERED